MHMAKKKTTKKPAEKRPFKPADAKPLKPAKPVPPKRDQKPLGALSAASLVLKAAKAPMTCVELIEAMAAKKLWTSPGGKTPANTLHAAIAKEIKIKGAESRFKKGERGKFEAA
jgi:hypothetical protein